MQKFQDSKGFKILKKIISLIFIFIIFYLEISTIASVPNIVGSLGFYFAIYSKEYFGLIAYLYPFLFMYLLYNYGFKEGKQSILQTLTWILLVFTFLIFQALTTNGAFEGKIGFFITSSLDPFIGNIGLWIFVLTGFVISLFIFFEEKEERDTSPRNIYKLLSYIKPKEKSLRKIQEKIERRKIELKNKKNKEEIKKPKVVVKEIGDTAQISFEVEDNTKKENILEADIINEEKNAKKEKYKPKIEEKISVIVDELEENKKLLDDIEVGASEKPLDFKLPPSSFFSKAPKENKTKVNEGIIDKKIADLLKKLLMFKIEGDVIRTYTGPVVTTFEFKPAPNVKVSKILNLQDDLAMALKAQTIRIQAPIPGKDVVGIEVPNHVVQTIYLKEILDSELFQNSKSPLTMILGKDIVGKPFVTDLKKLPHLLIAGTTGSGKSVGLNAMILSLLYKNSPDNLKLIMIDPKMLEFSMYNDIPHLLTPVITKATEAINALANMVLEMEKRYNLMSQTKTKSIETYNEKAKKDGFEAFPYIVIIIDELADLMMTSGKDVELSIARLAQMARASGIHLIVATQRPSVDVVTGLIKANLPSRISYKVGQKVDSKIILDSMGAESLLGRGDMLFTPPGTSGLVRLHAPWSSEEEIQKVVDFLKAQRAPNYNLDFLKQGEAKNSKNINGTDTGQFDKLFEDAKSIVLNEKKSSISYIQRRLNIGYNRAATIVEQLEESGILSAPNTRGAREILM